MSEDFWSMIEHSKDPVAVYGTGDGAEKLTYLLRERGRDVDAYFASDAHVRNRVFMGCKVLTFEMTRHMLGDDMIVLGGFGTHNPKVIEDIIKLSKECRFYFPDLLLDDEGRPFTYRTLDENRDRIERIYSALEDDESRRVFENNIRFRLSASIEPLLCDMHSREENWSLLNIGHDATFLDCGAYDGDTIRLFRKMGGSGRAIGLEPDARSFRKLEGYAEKDGNCTCINGAIHCEDGRMLFDSGDGRGSCLGTGKETDVYTIDSIMNGSGVDIIKMDIEGQEENALLGGRRTISEFRPSMCISAYHRIDDYWHLPEIVDSIRDDYRIYMRRTVSIPAWDTEFYFV